MLLNIRFLLLFIGVFCSSQLLAQCPNSYSIVANNQPTCAIANNGRLSLNSTTYYSSSTYLWSNGATSESINNIPTGNYSVTVTDPTQCTYTASFYLAPSPNTLSASIISGNCNTITASLNNSTPSSYQWSNGATSRSINPPAGTYSVTITDIYGCSLVAPDYTVSSNAPGFSITSTVVDATCGDNGSIDLTVTGGGAVPSYYLWSDSNNNNFSNAQDLTNIASGTYQVFISDTSNCSQQFTITVGGPSVEIQSFPTSCGSTTNGQLSVNTNGLTNPTYLWNTGATTATLSGLSPYTGPRLYTVTVTDGNCTYIRRDTVEDNWSNSINIYAYVDTAYNCNTANEVITQVYGGSRDYSYQWSNGSTDQTAMLTSTPTTYIVTVTDNIGGCSSVDSVIGAAIITNINISGVVTDATCGNNDGAIDLTVTGGSANYAINWQPNGETTEDLSNIYAGRYIVAINDNGCITTDTFEVGEFIELSQTAASCGLANGSATVREFGMTTPAFAWSTGANTRTVNNLAAGDHYITVTNGACVIIDTINVQDAGTVDAAITLSSTCLPDNIVASSPTGIAPFSILWNTGSTGQFIQTPTPGASYAVTITDANGCTDTTSVIIPNPPALSATSVVTDATCGNKNGAVDVTVVGGTPPFNFDWSHFGANIEDITGVYPGQYRNRITDNAGCVTEVLSTVGGQIATTASGVITGVNASNTGGAIDLTVNGTTNPAYLWNTGAITEDISGLTPGIYTVSITDAIGCIIERTFTIRPFSAGNPTPTPTATICGYVYDITATQNCATQGALPLSYRQVTLMPGNITVLTDVNGYYRFRVTNTGSYTVALSNNGIAGFVCPTANTIVYNNVQMGGQYCTNYYVTNPPFQDLWIDLFDHSRASPGFSYNTRIHYCNHGNTTLNGTIDYDYDPLLGFESITGLNSTLFLHNIGAHTFNWSFSNLLPAECRTIDVNFTVPTTTPLGTPLAGIANIYPLAGDANPNDNTDQIGTTVVGSYDPNDKRVSPYHTGTAWDGGTIYQSDEELEYIIRFQNTGTAPAQFVIIRDTLDVNLIPTTIRHISTKHDANIRIEEGNILIATFNNIYLPDSSVDFEASIGFIKFTINRQPNLPIGTSIENTAAIYFDFNTPIITNTPVSTIGTVTSNIIVSEHQLDMQTMPNPFNEQVTIKYVLEQEEDVTIQIQNSLGQVVKTYTSHQTQQAGAYIETINTQSLPAAMYLLVLSTEEKIITKRIIKH